MQERPEKRPNAQFINYNKMFVATITITYRADYQINILNDIMLLFRYC